MYFLLYSERSHALSHIQLIRELISKYRKPLCVLLCFTFSMKKTKIEEKTK